MMRRNKDQSMVRNPEMTQMIGLADEDVKRAILSTFYMFQNVEENTERTQTKLLEMKKKSEMENIGWD